MRQQQTELDARRVAVMVVTFEPPASARAYLEEGGLAWPLLLDPERQLYRGYGMDRAGFWDLWGPATWVAYAREIAAGRLPKRSGADVSQRGGDVLIDPQGVIRLLHVGEGPADRPSVESLLAAVRGR